MWFPALTDNALRNLNRSRAGIVGLGKPSLHKPSLHKAMPLFEDPNAGDAG